MKIILNGKTHILATNPGHPYYKIKYETLIEMAGYAANRVVTATWSTKSCQGSLTLGQECVVEDGMIFNVMDTSNA